MQGLTGQRAVLLNSWPGEQSRRQQGCSNAAGRANLLQAEQGLTVAALSLDFHRMAAQASGEAT